MRLGYPLAGVALALACVTASPTVTGTLHTEAPAALPEGARVRVTLLDVSLLGAPARVVAEQELQAGGEASMPFTLAVPRRDFDAAHRYALTATIWDAAGKPLWITATAHPVLTQGAPHHIDVTVRRTGAWAAPSGPRVFAYACKDLSFRVEVTKQRALVFLPGRSVELPAVPAASGAKYSDGSTTFWSHGDEARLVVEGVEHEGCRAEPLRAR